LEGGFWDLGHEMTVKLVGIGVLVKTEMAGIIIGRW